MLSMQRGLNTELSPHILQQNCAHDMTSNQKALIYTTHIKKVIDNLSSFTLRSKIANNNRSEISLDPGSVIICGSEVAGVTFSDSDSTPVPKFLKPDPALALIQILECDSCSESGCNLRSNSDFPILLLKEMTTQTPAIAEIEK